MCRQGSRFNTQNISKSPQILVSLNPFVAPLYQHEAPPNQDFMLRATDPLNSYAPKTVTSMDSAARHGKTCHSRLNGHLPNCVFMLFFPYSIFDTVMSTEYIFAYFYPEITLEEICLITHVVKPYS